MITFSKALVLFTVVLTFIYLILLMLSEGGEEENRRGVGRNLIPTPLVLVALLGFTTLHFLNLKVELLLLHRSLVALLFLGFLLYIVRVKEASKNIIGYALFLSILIQLLIVYNPPYGLYFGEWTGTYAKMLLTGRYETGPYRFTYQPFPAHAGILVIFSEATGIPITWKLLIRLPSYVALIVIDLILFSLTRRFTGSWRAGIVATLIYSITPSAVFIGHLAKLTGLMLVLVTTLTLVACFRGEGMVCLVTGVIAYAAGIFYHATAGLAMFIVAGIVFWSLLASFMSKGLIRIPHHKSNALKICLILLIIITLIKWGWSGGFVKIIPSLYRNFLAMIEVKVNTRAPRPLYERVGINPIQAYPWSVPVAMASSLLLYILVRKREGFRDVLTPGLAVGGLLFLLLGFTSAFFRTGFAASMYPGYAALMPAAALAAYKIMRSRKLMVMATFTLLLVASAFVAAGDPMNMPGGWIALKKFVTPGEEQYVIASQIHSLIPTWYKMRPTRELAPPYHYIDPYMRFKAVVYEPTDPKYQKDLSIIHGNLDLDTIYILRWNQIFPYFSNGCLGNTEVDVFFNGGKYLALNKVR